jgi:hypothetical protein
MKPRQTIIALAVSALVLIGGLIFWLAYNARGRDNDLAVAVDSALATKTPAPTATRAPTATPLFPIVVNDLGRENFSYQLTLGVDGADNIYIGNPKTGQIQVFDPNGIRLVEWFINIDGAQGGIEAVDREGRLYTIVAGNLYQFDGLTGDHRTQIAYERGPGFRAVAVMTSGGLAAVWNRNWQDENPGENDLVLIDSEGKVVDTLEELWPSPIIMADGADNFYTAELYSVRTYTRSGEFKQEFKKVLPGTFTVDSEGRLYVAYIDITSLANNNSTQADVSLNIYRCNGVSTNQWGGIGCESDRVSQTVNGVTTNYVLDLNAGLTQVLSDGANTYVYGNGRIGELQPGGFVYHLGDALGSVRQLTDASGSVTLAQNYAPFGARLSSAGNINTQ